MTLDPEKGKKKKKAPSKCNETNTYINSLLKIRKKEKKEKKRDIFVH